MKNILFFIFGCCIFISAYAQDDCIPATPSPQRLVNNLSDSFPDFISVEEVAGLEQKLQDFSNQTSNQISIVIVDDLCGFEIPDYAFRLFDKWKIGQEKLDNGILIIIKPTGGAGSRDEGIVVGRGLEGAIPDMVTGKIRRNEMIPYFKQGQYYEGLDAAVNVLMGLAKGEINSDEYEKKDPGQKISWFHIVVILIVILVTVAGRKRRRGMTIGRGGHYYGGGFGSWGGGFGGGGGGGFGGFGGGSTGGGGSFGKW